MHSLRYGSHCLAALATGQLLQDCPRRQLMAVIHLSDHFVDSTIAMKDRLSRKAELRRLQGPRNFGANELTCLVNWKSYGHLSSTLLVPGF